MCNVIGSTVSDCLEFTETVVGSVVLCRCGVKESCKWRLPFLFSVGNDRHAILHWGPVVGQCINVHVQRSTSLKLNVFSFLLYMTACKEIL